MPGDIVLYEYEGQKTPAKVVEIYRDSVLVEDISGEYEPIEIDEAKIYPTEITPEILEKNYSSTSEWYFDGTNKYCLRISRYKDKWDFYYGRGNNGVQIRINIQYVHELQHCLKICGIDKTIEL